jgi:hypothetical protein
MREESSTRYTGVAVQHTCLKFDSDKKRRKVERLMEGEVFGTFGDFGTEPIFSLSKCDDQGISKIGRNCCTRNGQ